MSTATLRYWAAAREAAGIAQEPTAEPTLAAALREASVAELKPGAPDGIVDLLVASGLSASKGAARRTIAEGGVSVNNARIDTEDWSPAPEDFLHQRWLVLRRGKRNIAGVERVE